MPGDTNFRIALGLGVEMVFSPLDEEILQVIAPIVKQT